MWAISRQVLAEEKRVCVCELAVGVIFPKKNISPGQGGGIRDSVGFEFQL